MNCSTSHKICEKYHVTGYPTILLFRSIQMENGERCIPPEMSIQPSWIDYHGEFKVNTDSKVWLKF